MPESNEGTGGLLIVQPSRRNIRSIKLTFSWTTTARTLCWLDTRRLRLRGLVSGWLRPMRHRDEDLCRIGFNTGSRVIEQMLNTHSTILSLRLDGNRIAMVK